MNRSVQHLALGLALALFPLAGCLGVGHSQCALDGDCAASQVCTAGECQDGAREPDGGVCPALKPSFADINQHLFQVGCRVKDGNCHSADAVLAASDSDLSGDPYSRLVGQGAGNLFGSCHCQGCAAQVNGVCPNGDLLRVKAGDAASSYLAIKLRALSDDDQKRYGSSMPADHPGGTCAQAQAAIAQWIDSGAEHN